MKTTLTDPRGIDVGDRRVIEVTMTDAAGQPAALTDCTATVYPPSAEGAEGVDRTTDLAAAGDAVRLEVEFDAPGGWFLRFGSAAAGQVEWVLIAVRPSPRPDP